MKLFLALNYYKNGSSTLTCILTVLFVLAQKKLYLWIQVGTETLKTNLEPVHFMGNYDIALKPPGEAEETWTRLPGY